MQKHYTTIALMVCLLPWQAQATTLDQAMKMAEQHPQLRMAQMDIEAAQGQLSEQSAYAYNPELSLESQSRELSGGGAGDDYYITLSQGIELGGKRGYREQVAQAEVDATMQQAKLRQQDIQLAAARSFVGLYFAKAMVNVRQQQSDLLKDLSIAMQRKLDVGDANILEANLANAAFASSLSANTDAQHAFTLAQAYYEASVAHVAAPASTSLLVLPKLDTSWALPNNPLAIALAARPDGAALQAKQRQLDAQASLANAARIPDLTISVMRGQEAGETLTAVGVSFPIPFWNTHTGAYKASVMQALRVQGELAWFEQRLKLDVQAAVLNHGSAMLALSVILQGNQGVAGKNIALARLAYKAGELSLEDLVIHINQALDADVTALNIRKQGWLARIRLAEVLGHPEYILQGVQQ